MSLEEVVALLGTGKLVNETETASLRSSEYEWTIGEMKITVTFENNKLTKKSQKGVQ
jgi:hypothetical protein